MDIDSGCLTVKQKISKKFSKKQEKKTKQDPPSRQTVSGKSCRSHIGFAFDTPESAAG